MLKLIDIFQRIGISGLMNSNASVLIKLGTPAPSLALEAAKVAAVPTLIRLTYYDEHSIVYIFGKTGFAYCITGCKFLRAA